MAPNNGYQTEVNKLNQILTNAGYKTNKENPEIYKKTFKSLLDIKNYPGAEALANKAFEENDKFKTAATEVVNAADKTIDNGLKAVSDALENISKDFGNFAGQAERGTPDEALLKLAAELPKNLLIDLIKSIFGKHMGNDQNKNFNFDPVKQKLQVETPKGESMGESPNTGNQAYDKLSPEEQQKADNAKQQAQKGLNPNNLDKTTPFIDQGQTKGQNQGNGMGGRI